jgi:MerR family transcriptional regulator, light-induced transcriptional regulator
LSDLLSPKQVARAIGVSESSLKRWVDQGLIRASRTAGGHRKLPLEDVLRFVREREHQVVDPDLLKLPSVSPRSESGLTEGSDRLMKALLAGNEELARQIVFDLYLARHRVCDICDHVIAVAFREIGCQWSCQQIDAYEERRGCEISLRLLYELRRVVPHCDSKWLAVGGTISGDHYTIPDTMAELVLRDAGWKTSSLGKNLPIASLVRGLSETPARLFWLSVSHVEDESTFLNDMQQIVTVAKRRKVSVVIGGQALSDSLRTRLRDVTMCDSMSQLDVVARKMRGDEPPPSNGERR